MLLASADTPTPFVNATSFPAARIVDISTLLSVIIPLLTLGGGLLFFVIILQAAFKYLTSEGKPEEIAKAQKTLIWAIIGLVVVICAYTFVKIIAMILNIQGQLPL